MRDIISVENMRLSDLETIKSGVPSLTLMRNAAKGILAAADWKGKISIVTGSGNNGGDGFALACELADISIPCEIIALSEKVSTDSEYYREEAISKNISIIKFDSLQDSFQNYFQDSDIIVDCIFGTGFHGDVKEPIASIIRAINESHAYVISADINSGVNGDTGLADVAVSSDITVSIGQLKNGFFINNAPDYIGKIINAYIDIPARQTENHLLTVEEFEIKYKELNGMNQNDNNSKKNNFISFKEYSEMPQGIETLSDLKKLSIELSKNLLIKTKRSSFLVDSSTVWISSEMIIDNNN